MLGGCMTAQTEKVMGGEKRETHTCSPAVPHPKKDAQELYIMAKTFLTLLSWHLSDLLFLDVEFHKDSIVKLSHLV